MNKTLFVDYIAREHNISKTEANKIINIFTDSIALALAKGEEVNITGFGNFYVSKIAARIGRNPRTNEQLTIAAYVQPKFSTGKSLKDACNDNK